MISQRHRVVIAMLAAALFWACGIKSRPLPPESVRPKTIMDLRAQSVAGGVALTWGRPQRLVNGEPLRNLAQFQVFRRTDDQPGQLLTQIPVTDLQRFRQQHHFSYVDKTASLGMRYGYWVISVTLDGYYSHSSNVVTIVRRQPPPPPNPENFVFPTPVMPH